jgi:BON domain
VRRRTRPTPAPPETTTALISPSPRDGSGTSERAGGNRLATRDALACHAFRQRPVTRGACGRVFALRPRVAESQGRDSKEVTMHVPGLNRKTNPTAEIAKRAGAAAGALVALGGVAMAATRGGRALLFGKARAAANAVTPSGKREYDDVTLTRKVESEIFRGADSPKGQISVNAEDGVVFLRGQVKNPEQMKELEAAARKVGGVKDVNNLLHTPKTEPLTKVEGKTRSVATR